MTNNQSEALGRAVGGLSMTNYPAIFAGFMARGIPEAEIKPRVNIFTYAAWEAQGKHVKRGEHGVRVLTWVHGSKKRDDGTNHHFSFPKSSVVFHVSQVH